MSEASPGRGRRGGNSRPRWGARPSVSGPAVRVSIPESDLNEILRRCVYSDPAAARTEAGTPIPHHVVAMDPPAAIPGRRAPAERRPFGAGWWGPVCLLVVDQLAISCVLGPTFCPCSCRRMSRLAQPSVSFRPPPPSARRRAPRPHARRPGISLCARSSPSQQR